MSEVGHYFPDRTALPGFFNSGCRPYSHCGELCKGSGSQTSTRWDQRQQQCRVSQLCEVRGRLLTVVHGKNGAAIWG